MDNSNMPRQSSSQATGKAVASLILGVSSIIGCAFGVGLVCGIIGLVLANVNDKETGEKQTVAKVGRILSIMGIVFSVLWIACSLLALTLGMLEAYMAA